MRNIPYDQAVALLRKPGHVLVKTFLKTQRGKEYAIIGESGGPVTDIVAGKLLDHPQCHEVDPGLFRDASPQTWTLFNGA